MSRKIGFDLYFLTEAVRERLTAAAEERGFTAVFDLTPEEAADCEIIFGNTDPAVLSCAKELRWFGADFAGVEIYCREGEKLLPEGCLFTNSSGVNGLSISEHIIMAALMLLRREPEYAELVGKGGWETLPGDIRSLHDARITLLGTGDIGTETARRLRGFLPAALLGVSRSGRPHPDFDRVYHISELDSLLPSTDILIMALPDTPETRGLLDRERLALLPEGACVINVGRGTAIDQEALCDALNSGRLGGAALDVTVPEPLPADHPLRSAKHLLLTPHVAGNMSLAYSRERVISLFLENLDRYCSGRPLLHLVDITKGY